MHGEVTSGIPEGLCRGTFVRRLRQSRKFRQNLLMWFLQKHLRHRFLPLTLQVRNICLLKQR